MGKNSREVGYHLATQADLDRYAASARREALRQCGTRNCKIAAESRNGCLATAYGGGRTGIGVGNTEAQATEDAINSCEIRGSNCEPRYVHCNLPVRIR